MTVNEVRPEEVVAALERVLDSDAFRTAPSSRNFLAYVVTETLAGRGHRLSERTVGRRALGRPDDFDGRFDASVRVRATRVRKALEAYYGEFADPVRILLPAGNYQPEFRRADVRHPSKTEPAVVVTTAASDSEAALVEAIAQELTRQLNAFPGLRVVGPVPAPPGGPHVVADRVGVRFSLHTSVDGGGTTAVNLTVFDAHTDATVWTTRETLPARSPAEIDLAQWARRAAGQIGDFTGVILTRSGESRRPGDDEWQAMHAYYSQFATGDRQAVVTAADKLSKLVAQGPSEPTVVAALAHSLSLKAGYELGDNAQADRNEAASLALRALDADQNSATAHLALATVNLVDEQTAAAVEHAAKAAELAPYHPSTLGTAGVLMALAGSWDRGVAAIRHALLLNPDLPGFSRTLPVMDHLFNGDDALALAEASLIDAPSEVWGPYFRALALMGLGYDERAHAEMQLALAIDPAVLDDIGQVVQGWVQLTPGQMQVLIDRLRMFQTD